MPVPFLAKFAAFWVAKKATVYLAARLYGFPKIYRRLSEVNKKVLFPNDPAKRQKVVDLLQSTFRLPNKIAQQYSEWTGAVQAVSPNVKEIAGRNTMLSLTSPRSGQLNLVPFAAKPAYKKAIQEVDNLASSSNTILSSQNHLSNLWGSHAPGQLRTNLSSKIDASRLAMGSCLRRSKALIKGGGFISSVALGRQIVHTSRTRSPYLGARSSQSGLRQLLESTPADRFRQVLGRWRYPITA